MVNPWIVVVPGAVTLAAFRGVADWRQAPWEDWAWGTRAEPAYQRFLREYRPAKQADKRHEVGSVELTYLTLRQSEADRVGA